MALLIDASVVISLERRGFAPSDVTIVAPGDTLGVASMSVAELMVGVRLAALSARQLRCQANVEGAIGLLPLVPVDHLAARTHAQISADHAARGMPIGPNDP